MMHQTTSEAKIRRMNRFPLRDKEPHCPSQLFAQKTVRLKKYANMQRIQALNDQIITIYAIRCALSAVDLRNHGNKGRITIWFRQFDVYTGAHLERQCLFSIMTESYAENAQINVANAPSEILAK
jgi:hypothetical protein